LAIRDCMVGNSTLPRTAPQRYGAPVPICPIELTRDLIACPSVTPADAGAQVLLGRHLRGMGFACHPMAFGQVPNLFARLGDAGPGVLYGRGASDMKGSVACFTAAVSRYLDAHGPPPGSISLLITGDEEGPAVDGTAKVLEWAEREGHIPDVCIVGECTNPDRMGQEIKIGRRGNMTARLRVEGKQCHVAWPQRGHNPIPDLVRLLMAVLHDPLDEGSAYFQPTNMQITEIAAGVGADNIIPPLATATLKLRFSDAWNTDTLITELHRRLDAAEVAYHLDVERGAGPFLTPVDAPWPNLVVQAVADVMGALPALTTSGGTSDARFIHHYCPVVEYGAVGASAHQIDEHAALDDLEALTRTYVRVLERYFGTDNA